MFLPWLVEGLSAANMAGDPRGNELLHSLEKVLNQPQLARARELAVGLPARGQELSAAKFGQ